MRHEDWYTDPESWMTQEPEAIQAMESLGEVTEDEKLELDQAINHELTICIMLADKKEQEDREAWRRLVSEDINLRIVCVCEYFLQERQIDKNTPYLQ